MQLDDLRGRQSMDSAHLSQIRTELSAIAHRDFHPPRPRQFYPFKPLEKPQQLPDLLMGLECNLLTEVKQQRLIACPLESRVFARRSNHPRESIPHAPVRLVGQAFLPVLPRAVPSVCWSESIATVRVKTVGNRPARYSGPAIGDTR